MSRYQGKDIAKNIKNPQAEALQNKNFKSLLIKRYKNTQRIGTENPKGPFVNTASALKMKNNNNPGVFLSLFTYPQKKESSESRMNIEKIRSVNTVRERPM